MVKRSHHGVKRSTQTEVPEEQKEKENDKNHRGDTGDVPGDQPDWDVKEVSGEGYCQNGMFLDPGDQVLETFSNVVAAGESWRA